MLFGVLTNMKRMLIKIRCLLYALHIIAFQIVSDRVWMLM